MGRPGSRRRPRRLRPGRFSPAPQPIGRQLCRRAVTGGAGRAAAGDRGPQSGPDATRPGPPQEGSGAAAGPRDARVPGCQSAQGLGAGAATGGRRSVSPGPVAADRGRAAAALPQHPDATLRRRPVRRRGCHYRQDRRRSRDHSRPAGIPGRLAARCIVRGGRALGPSSQQGRSRHHPE